MSDQLASGTPALVTVARVILIVQTAFGYLGLLVVAGLLGRSPFDLTVFLPAIVIPVALLLIMVRWRSRRRWVWITALVVEALTAVVQTVPLLVYGLLRPTDLLNVHLIGAVAVIALLSLSDVRGWFDR
ncbi:hypothetical protein [Nonomuraea sp. NPDC003727]